jgi:arylformamidase
LERFEQIEAGGSENISRMELSAHTGTHVDAPYHFIPEGASVEKLSLKILIGRAYVLYLPEVDEITASVLERSEIPPRTRRLLFKTRNSDFWKSQAADFQTSYVAISSDGAQFLVDRGVKLVGVDYLSVAPYDNSHPTHEILLKAGTIVVEGLDLSNVSQGRYTLYCLPLKLAGADGSPARAVLIGV